MSKILKILLCDGQTPSNPYNKTLHIPQARRNGRFRHSPSGIEAGQISCTELPNRFARFRHRRYGAFGTLLRLRVPRQLRASVPVQWNMGRSDDALVLPIAVALDFSVRNHRRGWLPAVERNVMGWWVGVAAMRAGTSHRYASGSTWWTLAGGDQTEQSGAVRPNDSQLAFVPDTGRKVTSCWTVRRPSRWTTSTIRRATGPRWCTRLTTLRTGTIYACTTSPVSSNTAKPQNNSSSESSHKRAVTCGCDASNSDQSV